eukprot:scaffold68892_cov52-Phaeocystis_antarctica.AAC.3
MSFLSKGAAPTTNRAVFGEVASSSSCAAPLRFLAPRLHLVSFVTACADTCAPGPTHCTYQRHRAACPEAPRTVRTAYA